VTDPPVSFNAGLDGSLMAMRGMFTGSELNLAGFACCKPRLGS
jgi:hypothetical protein